ncbi:MAG: endonuclease III domain-containing protein [bacterium]|nr:endonuclease III domain-containing protein [bacterium]
MDGDESEVTATATKRSLERLYGLLSKHYGLTHWWPGDTPFEIAVGAVLTQNAAWTNVEKAIANLKQAKLLAPRRILDAADEVLHEALRPSGYFRLKTKRVRSFCAYLVERYGGSMKRMARRPLDELRPELLAVNGIGPETADDILLYACNMPVFVVDAYTRRILSRHGLCPPDIGYEDLRALFERRLEPDLHRFQEYHGLIVFAGKDFCRRTPKCSECPLHPMLKKGQPLL